MKVAVFSTEAYDREFLTVANTVSEKGNFSLEELMGVNLHGRRLWRKVIGLARATLAPIDGLQP